MKDDSESMEIGRTKSGQGERIPRVMQERKEQQSMEILSMNNLD
jgi:hypothetical protein